MRTCNTLDLVLKLPHLMDFIACLQVVTDLTVLSLACGLILTMCQIFNSSTSSMELQRNQAIASINWEGWGSFEWVAVKT